MEIKKTMTINLSNDDVKLAIENYVKSTFPNVVIKNVNLASNTGNSNDLCSVTCEEIQRSGYSAPVVDPNAPSFIPKSTTVNSVVYVAKPNKSVRVQLHTVPLQSKIRYLGKEFIVEGTYSDKIICRRIDSNRKSEYTKNIYVEQIV